MDPLFVFFSNHPLLFAALGAVLVLLVLNEVAGNYLGVRKLSPPEAVRLINDRDALVVDLRPVADYKRGHILNAVNIPAAKLTEKITEYSKTRDKPIVLVCALGGQATQGAEQLRKAGYTEAFPLRGGINDWLGASLPVTAS
ncbi:MAG: rhodanese-like domain-containing protein [Pseudomonadota bacterium]